MIFQTQTIQHRGWKMLYEPSLLGYETTRSEIEKRLTAAARALIGDDKAAVVHGLVQVAIDLCLEDDDTPGFDAVGIMRHNGRSLLEIVQEITDRADAIERTRALGLPDTVRN
jgi:hypothetical protein